LADGCGEEVNVQVDALVQAGMSAEMMVLTMAHPPSRCTGAVAVPDRHRRSLPSLNSATLRG
jgi:hypothetical protein